MRVIGCIDGHYRARSSRSPRGKSGKRRETLKVAIRKPWPDGSMAVARAKVS